MAPHLSESLVPESLAQAVLGETCLRWYIAERELWGGLQQLNVPEIIHMTSNEFTLHVKTLCKPESVFTVLAIRLRS